MTTPSDDAASLPTPETSALTPDATATAGATATASGPAPRLQGVGGLGFKPQHVRLKSLTLDNFKSFAHRTQISLLEGFTAISGPNGSGKSNLIDAMPFVLGFASSKGLRADRLTDLINSESGKPQARVELELEVETARQHRRDRSHGGLARRASDPPGRVAGALRARRRADQRCTTSTRSSTTSGCRRRA